MTMGIRGFKTKKELKAAVGQDIRGKIIETSMFGAEYKPTGRNTVVGPDPYTRKWFATITTADNIITKVE